eukprot:GCRY01003479.1.p1 GENE.GCRY01003479.1~~GCRY01003479.1.p1  ORF type:complete len:569 (-),score=172.78 GCRY01003479.1:437-2143(-)
MDLVLVYTKQRSEFGRWCNFALRPAEIICEIHSQPNLAKNYIECNPVSTSVQCAPEMSEHEVNPEHVEVCSQGVLHLEGGWPKDVDPAEGDQTIRFRKKIEKDDEYIDTVRRLGDMVETAVKLNNSINVFEEYFGSVGPDHSTEPPSAKSLVVLKDPHQQKRSVMDISWCPDGSGKFAAAYCNMKFLGFTQTTPLDAYIWHIDQPNHPDLVLKPPSPLCSLAYNPKDPHLLLGGTYTGIVGCWDTRKGGSAVDTTPVEKGHRDPVTRVAWIQSKSGSECLTISTDGRALWWDTRKLSEAAETLPLEIKGLGPANSNALAGVGNPGPGISTGTVGGFSLDYDFSMPTRFMVGSERGHVLLCNRKVKSPSERIVSTFLAHHGPVYSLQRNPFFNKYFLSVGDWSAKIWHEDIHTPVTCTTYGSTYLSGGAWSPVRPAVFFSTKMDGTLDVWDVLYKQNDPAYSVKVSDSPLHSLATHENGKLLLAGSADGSVTLLELCEGLSAMQSNEKQAMQQLLEREARREKNLGIRAKEMRLKQKQKSTTKAPEQTVADDERGLEEVEKEFWEAIKS